MDSSFPSVDEYLERIGLNSRPDVSLSGLTTLQGAHLSHVPFENLDVYGRVGVSTSLEWSVPKIVRRGRGGWCFENNGAFSWLLGELGFDVTLLAANVLLDPPDSTNDSHLTLRVNLDRPYLVDVGFGDSFTRPIPLHAEASMTDVGGTYVLQDEDPYLVLCLEQKPRKRLYRFTLEPKTLPYFTDQSIRLQTLGESDFTEKPFATRLLNPTGDRVSLLSDRLKTRTDGTWTEEPISRAEWGATLRKWFGFEVEPGAMPND